MTIERSWAMCRPHRTLVWSKEHTIPTRTTIQNRRRPNGNDSAGKSSNWIQRPAVGFDTYVLFGAFPPSINWKGGAEYLFGNKRMSPNICLAVQPPLRWGMPTPKSAQKVIYLVWFKASVNRRPINHWKCLTGSPWRRCAQRSWELLWDVRLGCTHLHPNLTLMR